MARLSHLMHQLMQTYETSSSWKRFRLHIAKFFLTPDLWSSTMIISDVITRGRWMPLKEWNVVLKFFCKGVILCLLCLIFHKTLTKAGPIFIWGWICVFSCQALGAPSFHLRTCFCVLRVEFEDLKTWNFEPFLNASRADIQRYQEKIHQEQIQRCYASRADNRHKEFKRFKHCLF